MGILIGIAIAVSILFFYIYQSETSTNTLRDLLVAGKWYKANEETHRLISVATQRAMGKYMETRRLVGRDELNYTPDSIVRAIDQLWVKYSNGHFGFSVQLGLLEECKKNDWKKQEIMSNKNRLQEYVSLYSYAESFAEEMGERTELVMFWEEVGWTYVDRPHYCLYNILDSSRLNYSIKAPKGHLPFFYREENDRIWYFHAMYFLRRFKKVNR